MFWGKKAFMWIRGLGTNASGDGGRGDGVPRGFDGGKEWQQDGVIFEPGGRKFGPRHLLHSRFLGCARGMAWTGADEM